MIDLLIIGAGGFGREIAEYARMSRTPCRVKGFLDDDESLKGRTIDGTCVLASTHDYRFEAADRYVVAIADPRVRRGIVERAAARGGEPFILVHPTAYVSPTAVLGDGVIVGPFAFVGPAAALNRHACLSAYASLGHDACAGEHSVLSPYAAVHGVARVEPGVFMGSGAAVLPGLRVGAGAKIAAGAIVTADVPAAALAVGNPARTWVMFGAWDR